MSCQLRVASSQLIAVSCQLVSVGCYFASDKYFVYCWPNSHVLRHKCLRKDKQSFNSCFVSVFSHLNQY